MIRTFSEAQFEEVKGIEILDQHSETVPDMSLSVKEILMRFRRGTIDLASLTRQTIDEEDDIDNDLLDDLHDMVDVMERKEVINGKVSQSIQHYRDSVVSTQRDTSESEEVAE